VIASTHHWILSWLGYVFAYFRIVRIHWDDEIEHLVFENLLALSINNVPTSSTISILRSFFIIFSFVTVLDTKVSISVKILPSWSILIIDICTSFITLFLWNDSHRVQQKSVIFFQMSWTQNFKLECWRISLFNYLLKHHFSTLGAIIIKIVGL